MKPRPPHRRGSRSGLPADPYTALRDYAIRLHDKGDGHGVDWAKVAETCCKVAFSCMRELPPGDKGLHNVARRAHDAAAYSLMTEAPDSGTPYTTERADRPSANPDPSFAPKPDWVAR